MEIQELPASNQNLLILINIKRLAEKCLNVTCTKQKGVDKAKVLHKTEK